MIAAYLGCLRAGHVVFPFDSAQGDAIDALADRFGASVLMRERDGQIIIDHRNGRAPDLHPDLALLLTTSGSSGAAKLVKLSARNLDANAASIIEYLGLSASDRAMAALPLSYSYGLSVLHSHLACGASLVLTPSRITDGAFWDAFRAERCTSFAGVPYTFEILDRLDGWDRQPTLRTVTQAGGRLDPAIVRRMASRGEANGWRFFVMYGQTEAAPRMAYLRPELAGRYADCIGEAIPGGTLSLLDPDGNPIDGVERQGELAYRGPNVMMGYALEREDLATDETPDLLRTGDLAVKTDAGVYRIVGRASRIVKPFGRRFNLDDLEADLKAMVPGAACAGTDEKIVIAVPLETVPADFSGQIAQKMQLPAHVIRIHAVEAVPKLSNGKTDYRAILALGEEAAKAAAGGGPQGLVETVKASGRLVASPRFFGRVIHEAFALLGLANTDWQDVRSIYAVLLARPDLPDTVSFAEVAGDSLTYVQTALALEEHLGFLPEGWDTTPARDLEGMRENASVV